MKKESFVNLKNARNSEQKSVMEKIRAEGFCPFCPENIGTDKVKMQPIIKHGQYWHIRNNSWPYKNTRVHLLLILNRHAERLSEITHDEWAELLDLAKWSERKYQIKGGGVGFRFGDPSYNGATVRHIHLHILTAKITDRKSPRYQPVVFPVS